MSDAERLLIEAERAAQKAAFEARDAVLRRGLEAKPAPVDEVLQMAGAAKYLKRSSKTVRRMVEEGRLTGYQDGPRTRLTFRRSELDAFLSTTVRKPVGLSTRGKGL